MRPAGRVFETPAVGLLLQVFAAFNHHNPNKRHLWSILPTFHLRQYSFAKKKFKPKMHVQKSSTQVQKSFSQNFRTKKPRV